MKSAILQQRIQRVLGLLYVLAWSGYGALYLHRAGGGASTFWLFDGPVLVAAALMAGAVLVHRPARRGAWLGMVAGVGLLVAGDAVASVGGLDPFPSLADVAYLAGLLCLAAAIGALVRTRDADRDRADLVDTGIIITSVGFLLWILVAGTTVVDPALPPLGHALAMAYPIAVALLLAPAVRLCLGGGQRTPAHHLVVAGTVFLVATQVAEAALGSGGAYRSGGPFDLGWLAACACWAAGALHPSMRTLADPGSVPLVRSHRGRLAVLWTVSVAVPAVTAVQHLRGAPVQPLLELGALLLLFTLVAVRMSHLGGVTERLARRDGEDRLRALVHHIDEAVLVLDDDNGVTYASPAVERLWGARLAVDVERPLADADRARLRDALGRLRAGGGGEVLEVAGHPALGGDRHYEVALADLRGAPEVGGVAVTFRDVSRRKGLEGQLVHQAFHDPLTGLANRRLLLDRVSQFLAQRDGGGVALLFIDLDDFKSVNDGLGHQAGDELLREVAGRLREHVRDGDTAARLGGDEFAVVAHRATQAQAMALAERLVTALSRTATIRGQQVELGASVGVAFAAGGGDVRADVLLRNADMAMYAAKASGKHRCEPYHAQLHDRARRRLGRKADLRRALVGEELWLAYEPVVALSTAPAGPGPSTAGAVTGFAARLHWDHESGPVPAEELIPLGEEAGLIGEIGRWVLERACAEAASWPSPDPTRPGGSADGPTIAVDISGGHLRDVRVVRDVEHALRESGLPPGRLVLQLTEPAFADETDVVAGRLRTLASLGVRLSVAHFGTGQYPLTVLHRLPLHAVTLDRSLVDGVDRDLDAAALTRGVLDLTRQLGLVTVAEGVDRAAQRELLAAWGCAFGHGGLFAPPLPPAAARALVEPATVDAPRGTAEDLSHA